jgi:DNA-binding IclR family transcriptional regulator
MIQVIVRAIDILEFVSKHDNKPVQLIKIAENAGLSQPTCANIVKTLVAKSFLENVSRKEGYILGVNAYRLTGNVEYSQHLVTASSDLMQELVNTVNETCLLGILKNNKRVVIYEVQANNDLQVKTKREADIYSTASGKLLMAFLPEKELNQLIEIIGLPDAAVWPGIKSKTSLLKALEQINKTQLVQSLSSNHIIGFAIPVFNREKVVAAISVYLPESRVTAAHKKNILKLMAAAAVKIKQRLDKVA